MKPVRLRFRGLRSYRQPAEIDFAELDLFAIIGDTGAGKSSILEAITFALYAKKTWSGGSLNELIADGEQQLVVEFTFEADGDEWTVTRTRNRSSAQGINKLVNTSGSVKVDNSGPVNTKIEELLGLDCDQFKRAVLMPQGRFDELLRATPTERTKILTSILGLDELTTLRHRAETQRGRWRDPLTQARTERNLLPTDVDAALAAAERDSANAAARHLELTAATKAIGEAAQRERELGAAVAATSDALDRVPTIDASEVAQRLEQLRARRAELDAERDRCDAEVAELEASATELATNWTTTLGGFDGRDSMVAARGELQRAATGHVEATMRYEKLVAELAEESAAAPSATVDRALSDPVDAARRVVEMARAALAVASARRAHRELEGDVETAADRVAKATKQATDQQVAVDRCRQRVDAANEAVAAALRSGAVAAIAAHVHAGDDCPVCSRRLPESYEAPLAPDFDEAEAEQKAAERELELAAKAVADANAAVAVAEAATRDANDRLATAAATLAEVEDAARAVGVDIAHDLEEEAAELELASATEREARCTEALQAAQTEVAKAVATHEALMVGLDERIQENEAELRRHEAAVTKLPGKWRPDGPSTEASMTAAIARLDDALDQLDGLATQRSEVQEKRAACKEALQAIAQAVVNEVERPADAVVVDVAQHRARVADVATSVVRLGDVLGIIDGAARTELPVLPAPAGADVDRVRNLVTEVLDAALAIVADAEALRDRGVKEHAGVAEQIAAQLAGVGYDSLGELQRAEGEARQQAKDAVKAVETATVQSERASELDAFLDIGEPFTANLEVLIESLRDSAFIKHLVAARESELLAEANRRLLSITKEKFGFVAGFGVANTASGETRTPEALSGGERFQAALALALGLVEIASRGRGRLDAVFVDEGFGSLDAASLNAALSTLGSVAGGGKTVALISHLRPVAEFVETVLLVSRDDVLGSRIDKLDPDERDRMLADDIRSGLTA